MKTEPKVKKQAAKKESKAKEPKVKEPKVKVAPKVALAPKSNTDLQELRRGDPVFSVIGENLSAALRGVEHALAKRSTLPVLTHYHVQADFGMQRLKVTASSIERAQWRYVPGQIEKSGAVCLPNALGDFNFDGVAKFQVDPKIVTANIQSPTAHVNIKGISQDEFPLIAPNSSTVKVASLQLTRAELNEIAQRVTPATARDESRPILTAVGVFVEPMADAKSWKATFAAADGFRLAALTLKEVPFVAGNTKPAHWTRPLEVNVPPYVFGELLKLCDEDELIELHFYTDPPNIENGKVKHNGGSMGYVLCETPKGGLLVALVDGNYPDYTRIIPDGETKTIPLPADAIQSALASAAIIAAESNHAVRLECNPEKKQVKVMAQSAELGDFCETVAVDFDAKTQPETGFAITFNIRYLQDALVAATYDADSDAVAKLQVTAANTPGVFKSARFTSVVMPMNLN